MKFDIIVFFFWLQKSFGVKRWTERRQIEKSRFGEDILYALPQVLNSELISTFEGIDIGVKVGQHTYHRRSRKNRKRERENQMTVVTQQQIMEQAK